MLYKNYLVKKFTKVLAIIINFVLINYNFCHKNLSITAYHNHTQQFNQSNKYLAFSIFLKEKKLPVLGLNQIASQEIIITGINNRHVQNKLSVLFGIPTFQDQILSSKYINKLICKMKLSGFFTNIDIYNQYINTHQTIYINVTVNPILKSVRILDLHNKLIPQNYLISLFKKQIGYPVNFIEVDKSINLLKDWYHSRGYKWAQVYNITNKNDKKNLTIKISEGSINNIEITGYNKDYTLKKISDKLPVPLILKTLKVKPHQVLNLHNIDYGIVKLKNKKVILHCNYEIIKLYDGSLKLFLNFELLDDRYTYLFNKNVSITSSLLESIDILLHYSFNHLFYNHDYAVLDIFNHLSNFTHHVIHGLFCMTYLNMSEYDKQAYLLLKSNQQIEWPYMNEWCLTQLIFVVGDNFGFRHYMRNVGKNNSNYIIDIKFPQTGPYFNLKYEQPWINIYKNILSQYHIRLYKDTYTLQKNFIPTLLDQLHDSIFYYKNSILYQTGINLEIKHDLSKSIYIVQNMSLKTISYQYLLIHNSIIWPTLGNNIYYNVLNSYYSYFKQVWISNIQEFFQLDLSILSKKLHNKLSSNEWTLELNHFIPKKIDRVFYHLSNNCNYGNKMRIKMKTHQYLINNMLHVESEWFTFIGDISSVPYSERFFLIGPDIVRGYPEEIFPFPLQFGKIKLEYHIKIASYNTIFIFLDYAKNMNWLQTIKNYNLLFSPYLLNRFNQFEACLGYGIGLQIKTPVKQIPPLRIEYGYNIHNGQCFHLRLDK